MKRLRFWELKCLLLAKYNWSKGRQHGYFALVDEGRCPGYTMLRKVDQVVKLGLIYQMPWLIYREKLTCEDGYKRKYWEGETMI